MHAVKAAAGIRKAASQFHAVNYTKETIVDPFGIRVRTHSSELAPVTRARRKDVD
jgi:hypothetical protein